MDARCLFGTTPRPRTLGSPCAWCILSTPLGLIPRESWFRVVPRHSTAWLDWFPYLHRYLDAVRVKYRKGTYSVTIVTSVPWDMGTSTAFYACCVLRPCYELHARLLPSKKSEMRWQAADYIARRSPILAGYGGLYSLWLACHRCGLVRFFHLTRTNHVQL